MDIQGLDYNTQRERLVLPEYGREIQKLVDHAVQLPTKAERQRCAETIVGIMERMFAQNRENPEYKQKLWDHLALMSAFRLDIDWPYDVSKAVRITTAMLSVLFLNSLSNNVLKSAFRRSSMRFFCKSKACKAFAL